MVKIWEPNYLNLEVIKDSEKIKKVRENCEIAKKMIEDFDNSNYEFKYYNPLIASLLLEEKVPAGVSLPEVYTTSKGEKCYFPEFFSSLSLELRLLKEELKQLESSEEKITKEDLEKAIVYYTIKQCINDLEKENLEPQSAYYFLKILRDWKNSGLSLDEIIKEEEKFREVLQKISKKMDKKYYIRSLDREIDLFYNVLKNFKTNKPQFYMLVSKNKDIDFNISQEEVNKICEKTYGLIKDMEEIYEKISSDIINPLCKKKLPLSYEKFEGDIEELSKEIAEKLNTKGKVFELEILQGNGNEEDEEFYVKFTQYKNLPTYNDIGGYHFAKRIVKAWDPEKSERKSLSFVGEPGTGKTTLALAKLNEYANKTSGTGIVINRIPGYISLETLKDLLYALFSEKNKKLMLLLDDAEELVRVEKRRDTLKLLEELKASYVPVIMTFNDKNILRDEAIYGRLGIPVYFDFPNKEEREEILEILAKKYGIELSPSIKSKLAAHTENFSGRFLEMIFVYAKEMKNSQKNIEELLEEGVKYVKENIINPLRKYQGIYPFSSEEEKRYYYY